MFRNVVQATRSLSSGLQRSSTSLLQHLGGHPTRNHLIPTTFLINPSRSTATTGCRRKKKKVVEVEDNRLSVKEAVDILNVLIIIPITGASALKGTHSWHRYHPMGFCSLRK
jgi:hypothetical protein